MIVLYECLTYITWFIGPRVLCFTAWSYPCQYSDAVQASHIPARVSLCTMHGTTPRYPRPAKSITDTAKWQLPQHVNHFYGFEIRVITQNVSFKYENTCNAHLLMGMIVSAACSTCISFISADQIAPPLQYYTTLFE